MTFIKILVLCVIVVKFLYYVFVYERNINTKKITIDFQTLESKKKTERVYSFTIVT